MFQFLKFVMSMGSFAAGIAAAFAIDDHFADMAFIPRYGLQITAVLLLWTPGALLGEH